MVDQWMTEEVKETPQPASTEDRLSSSCPPIIGEHVVVNFEDGWCVSEVKLVDEINATVEVSCMKLKKVATADKSEHPKRFWIWPAKEEVFAVKQEHILPICPVLVLAKPPSTRRMLIFSIDNAEIIDQFFK